MQRAICGECGYEFFSLGGQACPRCWTPVGQEIKVPALATCPLCGELAPWEEVMRDFRCERLGRSLLGLKIEARWGAWGWRKATLCGVSGVRFALEYDDDPGKIQYRPVSSVRRIKQPDEAPKTRGGVLSLASASRNNCAVIQSQCVTGPLVMQVKPRGGGENVTSGSGSIGAGKGVVAIA